MFKLSVFFTSLLFTVKPVYDNVQLFSLFGNFPKEIAHKIQKLNPKLKFKKVVKYSLVIDRETKKYDINPDIVLAIIKTESNFNERAVSHTEDYGLMQVNAHAHKRIILDAEKNLVYGIRYLKSLNTDKPCWFTRYHSNRKFLRNRYANTLAKNFNLTKGQLCGL